MSMWYMVHARTVQSFIKQLFKFFLCVPEKFCGCNLHITIVRSTWYMKKYTILLSYIYLQRFIVYHPAHTGQLIFKI
jgi:hypothetical protein